MPNTPLIKGATVIIGFPSGETFEGLVRDTHDKETTGDIEPVRNEDNVEATFLVSNPGMRVTVDGKCTAAMTVVKGEVYAINGVSYLCEAAVNRHTPTLTRFSATFYLPTAADFTPPET
jgi:hypothetical protein